MDNSAQRELVKVLFLDIDGVLNHSADWIEHTQLGHPHNEGVDQLNRPKLALLERILEATEAKIVLSSTWRRMMTLQELVDQFQKRGSNITLDHFLDRTPTTLPREYGSRIPVRGNEINYWITQLAPSQVQIKSYAIVDDNNDFLHDQQPYFVQTTMDAGLCLTHACKIVDLLNQHDEDPVDFSGRKKSEIRNLPYNLFL